MRLCNGARQRGRFVALIADLAECQRVAESQYLREKFIKKNIHLDS